MHSTDFLVIGGGIIGLNIARFLKKKYTDCRVTVIEKEYAVGMHASGRNSGVLHAGFYYTADSLKAKFTKDGNKALSDYCEEKKILINKCGKIVVPLNEREDKLLDILMERGSRNDVKLKEISREEVSEIEPRAYTWNRAIFSPTTSTADPLAVITSIEKDAKNDGINIFNGVEYLKKSKKM